MHIGFASLATLISTRLWGLGSVKYTTIVITVVVFLVSEMIPKSYAKANNVKFALAASGSLLTLMKILCSKPTSRDPFYQKEDSNR